MKKSFVLLSAVLAVLMTASLGVCQDHRGPFTEPPRSVRSRSFDTRHVRLELTFNWDRREVRGRAVHRLVPYAPLSKIEFDAADMKIIDVKLVAGEPAAGQATDGKKLKFEHRGQKLLITLDRQYQGGEVVGLSVDYLVSRPDHGAHFVLPDESEPSQPKMVWTQSEPEFARYWFPCLDSPTDRLTSEILATVPGDFFVLSNGVLKGKKENADGTRTWHWVQEQSHVSYLMSVVAGEFDAYQQSWDDRAVVSYVPKGRMGDAARSFQETPAMIAFFSEKFGYRYPWPKYTQICVEEYGWGGMEHTSATTLNVSTLHDERAELDVSSDGLVAHELVHQWYGDLLTCKDWAEVWLNESFATYFATVWLAHDEGPDEATWKRYQEAESYFKEDKDRYRRPIVSYRYAQPGGMFDSHAYPKGGRVLHMLRFVLGDELFWKAIRHYTKKYAFDVVETAQFRIAVEEATGQGLGWFFDEWLHHGGHPQYDVACDWDDSQKVLRMTVKQTQKVDDLTPLFRMPVEIEMVTAERTVLRKVTVAKAEETFHFALDERPRRVLFDPDDWLLKKLTFQKSKQEWLDQLAHDGHIVCRVRAMQGLAEFTKDQDVLAALAVAVQKDGFWAVRQEAAKALGKFRCDKVRQSLLAAAGSDPKSLVRREAIKALGNFAHDDTRNLLRKVIDSDQSYYAVAEAIKALVKVDREGCRDDLLAAVQRPSHREVILKAAADGLAELDDILAVPQLLAMFEAPTTPDRRIAVLRALAKLGGDDPKTIDLLTRQADDARREVRSAAYEALAETGDPAAIELLVTRRRKEETARMVQTIDDNLAKLRQKQTQWGKLSKQVNSLEQKNQKLANRLKELEAAGK